MEVVPADLAPEKKPRAPTAGALCVRGCRDERPHFRVLGLWQPVRETTMPSSAADPLGEVRTVLWLRAYPNGMALVAEIRDRLLLLPELVSMNPGGCRVLTESHVPRLPSGTRGYWLPNPVRAVTP